MTKAFKLRHGFFQIKARFPWNMNKYNQQKYREKSSLYVKYLKILYVQRKTKVFSVNAQTPLAAR